MPLRRERFVTVLCSAVVGLFAGVQPKMRLKIAFLVERFSAVFKWANIVTHSIVFL